MGLRVKSLLLVTFITAAIFPAVVTASEAPKVLITSLKLGGSVTGQPTEYVEIYNDGDTDVDIAGWVLEYAKPTAAMSDCSVASWKQADTLNVKEVKLEGVLGPQERRIIEVAMNDNVGGSVRLKNDSGVIDLLGWGTEASKSLCFETSMAPVPPNTKSLKRWFTGSGYAIDSNNNLQDFTLQDNAVKDESPEVPLGDVCKNLDGIQVVPPTGYVQQPDGVCVVESADVSCSVIELSEILPNPSGSDTGKEYIELYNPLTVSVMLDGCTLKIGSSTKQLSGIIQPGYKAIYGLVLPNANGGTVELISATTESTVTYPADMSDDEAWANIDGRWQITNTPTPGAMNMAALPSQVSSAEEALSPCPDGKYRNPETNRCKNIETETGLKPCDPGHVRNPETNRCRKLDASSLTSLKPCSPGQERNPSTNRCRKVSASSSSVKPCAEGQERNPETNRCRKVAGVNTAANKNKNEDNSGTQTVGYFIFALVAAAALSYGAYEYRQEIGGYLSGLRLKLKR